MRTCSSRIMVWGLVAALAVCSLPKPAMAAWHTQPLPGTTSSGAVVGALVGGAALVGAILWYRHKKAAQTARDTQLRQEIADLSAQIANPANDQTAAAMQRLAAIGKPALKSAVTLSRNVDPRVRCRAAMLLANLQLSGAKKPLRALLTDADASVKIAALQAIAANGDKGALHAVTTLSSSPDQSISATAVDTLKRLQAAIQQPTQPQFVS